MGLAAVLIETTIRGSPHLAGFRLSWQVMAVTGAAVLTIMFLASLLSIRRVLVLEPASLFRS
jgi:putative ABC transport system permease protein